MSIVLVGGPFDGKVKLSPNPPAFVYAEGTVEGFVRFFRAAKPGRLLYRYAEGRMFFAHYTYAECCGAFHRRPDEGEWLCNLCGTPLHPM